MLTHTDNNSNSQDTHLIWRKLTLRVNHSANDLKLHTQRILFCMDNSLSDFSAGALQDLFIILQDKGKDLRLRMFNLISPLLSHSERNYFQQCIDYQDNKSLECHVFTGSVLASCEENSEVDSYLPLATEFKNKLEEAQYLIDSGQLSKARDMLEALCLENESDEIVEELQSFYFYAKDQEGLEHFLLKMSQKNRNLSSSWLALRKSSEMW